MLLVPCPWCGPRHESEFTCLGEATPARPRDPAVLSDDEWIEWLIGRENIRGRHRERWWHRHGCGAWFELARDTVSHEIDPA